MFLVQDLDARAVRDISGGDNARTFGGDGQALGPFHFHAQGNALEVQNDISDVFAHTGHGRKFVQHVVDLHRRDRPTLQRGQQHAPQRVAHGQAKTAFQRFGDHGGLTQRVIARLDVQLCWFDELSPVLVDHTALHSCSLPDVQRP